MNYAELIGYLASLLVAISLSVSSVVKLRWLNLLGALAFSVYGLWISAIPVFLVNFYISIMDIYYLKQIYKTKDIFEMVPISTLKEEPYASFIEFYKEDIQRYFRSFPKEPDTDFKLFGLFRNFKLIGLFGFQHKERHQAEIIIDYVTREYRDFKFGHYIFHQKNKLFKALGIKQFITPAHHPKHLKYLKKVGFKKLEGNYYFYEI